MSLTCYQRQLGAIMAWPGVGPKLPDVKTPTLVIHGDLDPLVPYPNGQYIASQIPGATLVDLRRSRPSPAYRSLRTVQSGS